MACALRAKAPTTQGEQRQPPPPAPLELAAPPEPPQVDVCVEGEWGVLLCDNMGTKELESGEGMPQWISEARATYANIVRFSQKSTGVKAGRPYALLWFAGLAQDKLKELRSSPWRREDQLARGAKDRWTKCLLPEMWCYRAVFHWFPVPCSTDLTSLFDTLHKARSSDEALELLANEEQGRLLLLGLLDAIRRNIKNFYGHADRCQELLRRTKDKTWNQVDGSWARSAKAAAQTIIEWFDNPEGRDLQVAAGTWEVFSRKMRHDVIAQESVKFVEVMAAPRLVPPVTMPINAETLDINTWHAALRRTIVDEVLLNVFAAADEFGVNIGTVGEIDASGAVRVFVHAQMPEEHAALKHSLVWACPVAAVTPGHEATAFVAGWALGNKHMLVSTSLDGWSIRLRPPAHLEKGVQYYLKFLPSFHAQMWTADAVTSMIYETAPPLPTISGPLQRLSGLQGTAPVYNLLRELVCEQDVMQDLRGSDLTHEQAELFCNLMKCKDPVMFLTSRAGAGKSHIMSLVLKAWLDAQVDEAKVAIFTTPKRMLRQGLLQQVRRILQADRWNKVVVCGVDDDDNDMVAAQVEKSVAPQFAAVLSLLEELDVQLAAAAKTGALEQGMDLHKRRMHTLWQEYLLPKSLEQEKCTQAFSIIICTNDKLAKELHSPKMRTLLKGRVVDLIVADECHEMPVRMAYMCAAACNTIILGGDKLQRTIRATQGRYSNIDEDKAPEEWEYRRFKEVGRAIAWGGRTRRNIFDLLEANATTLPLETMLRCGPEVIDLLKLSYHHEFSTVQTQPGASTDVVCVLFHGACWGTVVDDLGGGERAQTREGPHRRVYRDKGLFAAVGLAASNAIDAGQVTVVIFLTHRMRIAFEAFVQLTFSEEQRQSGLLIIGSPEGTGGLTANCVIFVMACRRYEHEFVYAGHSLDVTLRYVAMSRAKDRLILFLEWLWSPEPPGWYDKLLQRHITYFTRTAGLNFRGWRPFASLVLHDVWDFWEYATRLGTGGVDPQSWFDQYDQVDWPTVACRTRRTDQNTVADFFSREDIFEQCYEGIPRVSEGSEQLLKKRRDLYKEYQKWVSATELPEEPDPYYVPRLASVFIPSVMIHLLGRETTFFSVPFAASWFWHHLEGSDLPAYPAKRDKATEGHIEWAVYKLITAVAANTGYGLATGFHKMSEQEVSGFTWLYKRCWSERACFKIQHEPEQRRPNLYAYIGMGVEKQSEEIAGVVIRASSFQLVAKLFSVLRHAGGRAVSFDAMTVVNHSVKEPLKVAQDFRSAMMTEDIEVTDEAGDVQLGTAFEGEPGLDADDD